MDDLEREQKDLQAGFNVDKQKLLDFLHKNSGSQLRLEAQLNPKLPLIRNFAGQGMLHLGDIDFIKSQPGNGKTQACSLLAVAALGGGDVFGLVGQVADVHVYYFDTEMAQPNTVAFEDRVRAMLAKAQRKEAAERFTAINFVKGALDDGTAITAKLRWEMVETLMELHARKYASAPALIILDGIAQFFENINDLTESCAFYNHLASFCAMHRVTVLCVLHENQGSLNGKMRGHAGSIGLQMAREVYGVKRSGKVFTLFNPGSSQGCKYTYGASLPSISWSIAPDSTLLPAEKPTKKKKDAPQEAAPKQDAPKEEAPKPTPLDMENMRRIFEDHTEMNRKECIERVKAVLDKETRGAVNSYIDRCVKKGVLHKIKRQGKIYYNFFYDAS